MKQYICQMVSSAMLFAGAGTAGAVGLPAPGAVTPQTVKVPDGPGSVRGLANDAQVSSFTGQVSYEIPIALPAGQAGFGPKLALRYSGALGNGPLGLGWSFGQVSVRRSLRLGVPSYTNADELELVGLPGGTLVSIGNGQYRAEGQGNSIRGVAVDGGFELVDATGTRYRLGTSDASRLASGVLVAGWYLERVTDVAGHVIDYSYERRAGELFMTSIAWGGDNAFRADLVYEDRSDAVVSWRTGFKISTARRLNSIVMRAFGGIRQTVQLTYDQTFALSRLATVRMVGSDGTASPTTTLSYAPATAGQVQVLGNTGGWNLGNSAISFFDVDKDGAMDLLRIEAGSHRYRRNLGGTFGPEVVLGNAPAVGMASVRMLDLDGDSGAEMVLKSGSSWQSYRIVNNAWVSSPWAGSSALDLSTVAVTDLNGDNRMDVVTVSGNGIAVWFGTATGFAASRTLPAISAGEPTITPANVQFGDLNGDGLADALAVNSSGMIEFRGKGDGTFERIGPVSYPWTGTTDTTQVRLADLDRDGLLDIVRIGTSQVFWYRGKPDGTFNVQARVLDRPAGADASTVVQLADANGNGSTDVVWSSPSGMWALDLAGPTNAGLLVGIDNGLGKTQRFVYTASTQLAWAAEAAATPWSTRMPVSIAVTTTATQVLASGEPDRTSLLDVRDGIYEADERRFIGFAQSIQTLPGSAAADTIRIVTTYHPGHGGDRVLRGQPLSIRTEDGTGRVFRQVDNQCSALPVVGLPDDPRLKRAAVTQTQITTSEPGETPAVVRTRFAFDPEVRAYETRRDGRIVDGVALDGDESITRRTFTSEDPTTGVRDLVCEEDLLDGAETVVSQVQRRFGDATSVADPCHPGRGWVREELGYLAEQTRWVSTRQTAYDVDGNPTLIIADGVARTLGYDSHGLHPTSETVSPADGQTLVWTAQWDDVRGTLTRVDSAAGTSARMTYDGLGRLLSIAAGDALPHAFYRYQWESPRPRTETFTFDGEPSALGALPDVWTPTAGWRHAVTISNSAGEQLVAAVQLDTNQWNVSELRARDHRGRVTAVTSAFAFAGSDPGVATAPGDAATQTLVYDPLDRVTDQKLATGAHKRSTYHPLGVTIAIDGLATLDTRVDGQDRTTHTERTVDGVVESVDATYDAAGRIRQFRLQGDQVHHDFTYDSLGRMTGAVDPDVGSRSLGYDDAGRVVRAENGAGDVTTYAYDGAGRVISVDGPGIANRFHYDVARSAGFDHTGSQLAWVEDAAGSVDLGYDTYGHLMTHQRTVAGTSPALVGRETTVFSPSGLPRTVDLGDGVVLPLQYDAAGRVTQIADAWSVASYDAGDQPVREQYGNGVVQRYDRDLLHRPTRVTIENATGALYRVAASYHAFGPISTLTDDDHVGIDHTASFGFDGAGRLISAAMGTGTAAYHFNYGYDGLQNMTKREATGPSELGILSGSYQYRTDAPRQLDHIVAASGATIAGFAYDGAGRQVQHADKQLTYDALSKLVRVDGVAGGSIEHRYGYDGGRVWTRSAAGAMTYWITPNVVVRGNERDHYVRAGERVVAKITTTSSAAVAVGAAGMTGTRPGLAGLLVLWILAIAGMMWRQRGQRKLRAVGAATVVPLLAMISCASPFASQTSALAASPRLYYHQTYGAGPELTTDSAGQLVEDRRSEPFGAAIDAFRGGAVQAIDYQANPLNALNKFTDPDTRWSYHGARWLAPDTAQWHTPDPPATAPDPKFMQSPWGLNPYQYVNQNPVAYWDPDGKCSAPIIGPGQVGICIEAYIAADKIGIFDLGRGDNRGTEAYNPLETNRIQQQITFDLQNHTVASQTQIAMSEVVIPDLGFEMGGGGGPTSIVLQGTGETNVRDVWRNFAGGTDFKAGGHGVNGFSSMPGGPSGSIDYSFTFRVDDDGTVSLVGGGHKGYPSYSVYSYKADEDGNVTATPLLESKENKIEDLDNPFYGPQNNQPEYGPIQTYYDGGGGGGGGDE